MSGAIYRGTKQPLLQSTTSKFDASTGYTIEQAYKGFGVNEMVILANRFNQRGVTTRLNFAFGVATLETEDATGTYTIDKWEIAIDRQQPSVFENPLFLAVLSSAANTSTILTLMRQALQNASKWSDLVATQDWEDAIGGANQNTLKQYFDNYNQGVTNFLDEKYVLRHTTNAPNRWQVNIADVNPATIYSIGQMLSEAQNVNLWIFPLPGYLAYKILTYPTPAPQTNYFYGAYKSRSNAITCANNRVDISTEYIIDNINTNLYPFAS